MGYALGATLTGIIAGALGISASIIAIGLLTILSAGIIQYRMRCKTDQLKEDINATTAGQISIV